MSSMVEDRIEVGTADLGNVFIFHFAEKADYTDTLVKERWEVRAGNHTVATVDNRERADVIANALVGKEAAAEAEVEEEAAEEAAVEEAVEEPVEEPETHTPVSRMNKEELLAEAAARGLDNVDESWTVVEIRGALAES